MARWFLLVLTLLLPPASPSTAAEVKIAPALRSLFSAGDKNTPPAVEAARRQAEVIKRVSNDLKIDYAFGLVLANQHRYADSRRLIARFIAARPDDLPARSTMLWVEMTDGKYSLALESIDEILSLLNRRGNANPSNDVKPVSRVLGQCFAFIELAKPRGIDLSEVERCKNSAVAIVSDQRKEFDEGYHSVMAIHAEMTAVRDKALKLAQDTAEERSRSIASELTDSTNKAAVEREGQHAAAENTAESQRELRVVQQQLRSLAQDRMLLSAQIITLQASLQELATPTVTESSRVNNRGGDAPRPGDVFTRIDTKVTRTMPLDRMAQTQSVAFSLATLNKQAFDMDRLILSLQTRGAELTGISQAEFKKLSESQAEAEKAAKKAQKLSKQLERQEAAAKKRPAGPTGRMTRFSTYAPLPYEQETKRVLGWFEK